MPASAFYPVDLYLHTKFVIGFLVRGIEFSGIYVYHDNCFICIACSGWYISCIAVKSGIWSFWSIPLFYCSDNNLTHIGT